MSDFTVSAPVVLCPKGVNALSVILQYRYLSNFQVGQICGLPTKATSAMLLRFERHGLLGHFGNVGIRGYGKTPKMYFLKRRGHSIVSEELNNSGKEIRPFQPINVGRRWSPLMYHRVATLNVISYIERDCRSLQSYDLIGTLVEYRREKLGGRWRCETTDFVGDPPSPENKIVPDAGFVLGQKKSGKTALFLIEVDLDTTRLSTDQTDGVATYTKKLAQYDRYLASGRVAERYAHLGSFSGFYLLTVTTSEKRVANMRAAARDLSPDFHKFYRFSTLETVSQNFLHDGWLSRDHADLTKYSLIKGS